jgi:hypothetical protein
MNSEMNMKGTLTVKVNRAPGPGFAWKARNTFRLMNLFGNLNFALARAFSKMTGIPTIVGELAVQVRNAEGRVINYGTVCRRVVTDAGVAFIVDDWDNSATDITNFNFHGSGTGVGAESATDTALGTEVESRATGTKSQPAANQLRTVGTVSYTASRAITEHGIFSASSVGTLWDRSVFTAINVVNGDSITFTYTVTINSGG